jgi:competence protein ComEC
MKTWFLIFFTSIFLLDFFLKWPDQKLHLLACDVGQGDAILISLGQLQLLVDTGPDQSVIACLDRHLPLWDKKIDAVVLTHYDLDHIGGFDDLTQSYKIGYLFLPLTDYQESEAFLELQERLITLSRAGTIVKQPFLGQQVNFLELDWKNQAKYNSAIPLQVTFIAPFELSSSEWLNLRENGAFLGQEPEVNLSVQSLKKVANKLSDNNGSIAIYIQFGQLKMLLLGDLESTREVALVRLGLIKEVDIQKVGHHGSKTSSSLEFLLKSRPEMALISCGLNNKFDHPNADVLENLQMVGSQIWRTDQTGEIEVLSDGLKFWLKNKNRNLF